MSNTSVHGFRCSPQQQRAWRLLADGLVGHAVLHLRLAGELDVDRLESAVASLVERHEILRTRFLRPPAPAAPLQQIVDAVAVAWQHVQATDLAAPDAASLSEKAVKAAITGAFDLATDTAPRALLLRFAADRHELILALPALAADGDSLCQICLQLAAAYRHDDASAPDPGALQYAQFADWQQHLLAEDDDDRRQAVAFWQSRTAATTEAASPAAELRFLSPPAPAISLAPAWQTRTLEPTLDERLGAVSEQLGVDRQTVLFAAWQTLLWRHTGSRDQPTLGWLSDGRLDEDMAAAIGLFARALPTGSSGSPTLSFAERARQLAQARQQALDWQEYHVAAPADRPLAASFSQERLPSVIADGLTFELIDLWPGGEASALHLAVQQRRDDTRLTLRYDERALSATFAAHLLDQLATLLEHVVTAPDTPGDRLRLVGDKERCQLQTWNDTASEAAAAEPFIHAFARQAAATPAAVAVVAGDERLTYAQLAGRAAAIGEALRRRGVGGETIVGLFCERRPELVAGLLGIAWAGGAYLPLDPAYPADRLSFLLRDAGASLVLTVSDLLDRLPADSPPALCLDRDVTASPASAPAAVHDEQLSYVIYTSGSTGRPKGVMVPHRGLASYLQWCAAAYRTDAGSGSPVASSIGFDATITALLSPLLAGKTVTLVADGQEIEALADLLRSARDLSLVKLTPAHLELLNPRLDGPALAGRTHVLVLGGEALAAAALEPWRRHAPDTRLINEYGPTETVVGCCFEEVPADAPRIGQVAIGRPIAKARIHLLDRHFEVAAVGVAGEICIAGAGVARGYRGRAAETARRFVPDPLATQPGGRLYRSGDLARRLPDGRLEFLGRLDEQLQLHGFRIEPGEIEHVLGEHPAVAQAVVTVRTDQPDSRQLVAYIVATADLPPTSEELRQHCRQQLPDFMVPTIFAALAELPLSAHGKIDRGALPAPDKLQAATAEPVLPRTTAESLIADVWRGVLKVEEIGVHDNFFDLGGHSFLMLQANRKLRKLTGVSLSTADMFRYPTIDALARRLSEQPAAAAPAPAGQASERGARREALGRQRQQRQQQRRATAEKSATEVTEGVADE